MRNTSIFYVFILFIITISCTSKKEQSFIISGTVTNLNENTAVLSLVTDLQSNKTEVIDTLLINKKGGFKSVYFLEPAIYTLTFDSKKTLKLAIDKGQHLKIKGNSIEDLKVTGSVDTDLLNNYEAFRNESLNRLVKSVRTKIVALKKENKSESEITELRELEVENYQKHLNELVNFVKENMGTSIAIYPTSLRWVGNENLPFLEELVANFEQQDPTLAITNQLKEKLQLLKKTSIGGVISNITMPSSTNNIIKLNTIRKKYTLVDFWASWCPPCRSESKLLNELYSTYNSNSFEIYGISLDSNREKWINAIEKDARIWPEVSTVEGFKTPVSIEYGITALPTNFLIDETGKIIAVNVHGKQLKEKIESLFSEN